MSNTSLSSSTLQIRYSENLEPELSASGCLAVPWDEQASQGLFRSELSQLACGCDEEYFVYAGVCVTVLNLAFIT